MKIALFSFSDRIFLPLQTAWQARLPRERRALQGGALVLLPLLCVFGFYLPLVEHVEKLQRSVPQDRAKLAEIQAQRAWLQSKPPRAAGAELRTALPPDLASRLESELQAKLPGFKGSVRSSENAIDVVLEAAPFDALLAWMVPLARRDGLFAVDVQLLPAGSGWVAGRLRLQADSE